MTLVILVYIALMLVNTVGIAMVALQLPGTWVMLLATAAVAWWRWDANGGDPAIGWWTLAALLILAILGEVIETLAGALGTRKAGGTKRAAVLATIGGVVGAIVGTIVLVAIPIIGTLIGAALGAAAGSVIGDVWAGRKWEQVFEAGRGAAVGRFWGAIGKIVVAMLMWLVVLVAILVP